jgi:hypothetical protein
MSVAARVEDVTGTAAAKAGRSFSDMASKEGKISEAHLSVDYSTGAGFLTLQRMYAKHVMLWNAGKYLTSNMQEVSFA